jgi:hypothetical protein
MAILRQRTPDGPAQDHDQRHACHHYDSPHRLRSPIAKPRCTMLSAPDRLLRLPSGLNLGGNLIEPGRQPLGLVGNLRRPSARREGLRGPREPSPRCRTLRRDGGRGFASSCALRGGTHAAVLSRDWIFPLRHYSAGSIRGSRQVEESPLPTGPVPGHPSPASRATPRDFPSGVSYMPPRDPATAPPAGPIAAWPD